MISVNLIGSKLISFSHSFIMEIYIAPFQGYYSEALPTLARLKRRVLRQWDQTDWLRNWYLL